MQRILLVVISCWCSTLFAAPRILLLGDSLSAGYGLSQSQSWPVLLNQHWQADRSATSTAPQLINASISGETSTGGLKRLPALLSEFSPSHVIVELGGNDGLQGQSLQRLSSNLLQIITLAKQAGCDVALMQIQIPPNYGKRYTEQFQQLYRTLAEQQTVQLLPFFMTDIAVKPELMQADGIHPNASAQPLIRDFMLDILTQWLDH